MVRMEVLNGTSHPAIIYPPFKSSLNKLTWASQVAPVVKNSPASGEVRCADMTPGLGRSPGGGHGNPLQYSYLEYPLDRGAW